MRAALLLAVLALAAGPSLDRIRELAEIEVAVPRETIELPGGRFRCWSLRLASERGRAAREGLAELSALVRRLRLALAEHDALPAGERPPAGLERLRTLGERFERQRERLLLLKLAEETDGYLLLGVRVTGPRLAAALEGEDYRMERIEGCREEPATPGAAG